MNRNEPALKDPGPFDTFPTIGTISPTRYRAHNRAHSPWWFSADRSGRFDLTDGEGTCYLASDIETALRESFGPLLDPRQVISATAVRFRVVSEVELPLNLIFADLGNSRAVRFGAIREIATTTDYPLAGKWAAAFRKIPVDGIRYNGRFTSVSDPNSWALFGPAGEDTTRTVAALAAVTGAEACAAAGITIVDADITRYTPVPSGSAPAGPQRQSLL